MKFDVNTMIALRANPLVRATVVAAPLPLFGLPIYIIRYLGAARFVAISKKELERDWMVAPPVPVPPFLLPLRAFYSF